MDLFDATYGGRFSLPYEELLLNQLPALEFRQILTSNVFSHNLTGTWHPYGFAVFRLGRSVDGRTMRLHIWPEFQRQMQQPEWPIHSHPWQLDSYVLIGAVVQKQFDVEADARGDQCLYRVGYSQDCSVLERSPYRVKSALVHEIRVEPGQSYSVPHGQFHASLVSCDVYAATIVTVPPSTPADAYVLGDPSGDERYEFKRRQLSIDEIRLLVNRL
jgi:hypothetical protein